MMLHDAIVALWKKSNGLSRSSLRSGRTGFLFWRRRSRSRIGARRTEARSAGPGSSTSWRTGPAVERGCQIFASSRATACSKRLGSQCVADGAPTTGSPRRENWPRRCHASNLTLDRIRQRNVAGGSSSSDRATLASLYPIGRVDRRSSVSNLPLGASPRHRPAFCGDGPVRRRFSEVR